ncbi:hypothetical protein [Ralstonia sp. ASV6]|uniref:hypothetical protein n=1 Tax=Ralstonia sp. ASV6 TaxID=2795124 RepID=UPI0018EDB194|nr:hypothetical protein [Ralstonia sp. ASV6]
MRPIALLLASIGFVFGIAAAFYWWRASRITVNPNWPAGIAPVVPELEQLGWNVAFIKMAEQSGSLNRIAAALTAIAVVFTTASSVAGLLP